MQYCRNYQLPLSEKNEFESLEKSVNIMELKQKLNLITRILKQTVE